MYDFGDVILLTVLVITASNINFHIVRSFLKDLEKKKND
jgi:hypothetical protein